MNFKDNIRNRYQEEVKPVFEEKHWNSFLTHRERKKKKPRRLLFIILFFGCLSLFSAYWLSTRNIKQHVDNSLVTATTGSVEITGEWPSHVQNEEEVVPITAENLETEILTGDENSSRPVQKSIEKNAHSIDLNKTIASQKHTAVSEKSRLDEIAVKRTAVDSTFLGLAQQVGVGGSDVSQRDSVRSLAPLPKQLKGLIFNRGHELAYFPIEMLGTKKTGWQKSKHQVYLYGGLSFPFHVQTVEEQAHQFGGKLYYNLGKRFRSKVGLEFALISFKSTVMDPQLGVAIVESPIETVQFRAAIVESASTNMEIGADFLLFEKKSWQAYAGLSYGFSSELFKEIEYAFEGDDDNDDNDDVFLAVPDAKKYFVPHIIRFESGLQYQTSIGGFNLSLGYPYQLSKNNLELLGQLQINFGFTRRF